MSRKRRNETEEQRARRELISDFLSAANIQSMDDIQVLFKEALAGFMEGSLESELDDELGYGPYDVNADESVQKRHGIDHSLDNGICLCLHCQPSFVQLYLLIQVFSSSSEIPSSSLSPSSQFPLPACEARLLPLLPIPLPPDVQNGITVLSEKS